MTERTIRDLDMYLVTPESPFINLLLYSEPGDGKTTLSATAQDHPAMRHVLFANIEGGMISVAHRKDVHSIDVESVDDLYDLFWMFANEDRKVARVKTLVIDNVSELQRVNLDQIVSGRLEATSGGDPDDIWQEDYGRSTNQMERVFRWFKNWPINVIFTAHAKFVYPKVARGVDMTDIEPTLVLPKLTQQLCKTLMGLVDFVWFLKFDPETRERYLLTQPNDIYRAKTRGPRFAKAMGDVRQIGKDFMLPQIYDMLVDTESGKKIVKKKSTKRTRRA